MRNTYFESKALSKSAIDRMLECEAKYKAWLDGEEDREETKSLIFGGMFHKLTLEPQDFDKEYAVTDLDLRTKLGREWKKEKRNNGHHHYQSILPA